MQYRKLRIHCDGACDNRSKLKLMGSGIAIFIDGEFLTGKSEGFGGNGTSNISEYMALIMALQEAIKFAKDDTYQYQITIVGDSQLVIFQMQGAYKVKEPTLRDLFEEAKILETQLKAHPNVREFRYEWVRRERNKEADIYSKEGLAKNY